MKKRSNYNICAGWLPDSPVIGQVNIDPVRGGEAISFEYSRNWLQSHPSLILDPLLFQDTSRQYVPSSNPFFGFLSDISPDRWGRKLMDRRESADAAAEQRAARSLRESDYILGVHDGGRQGGIRIQDPETGIYISDREELAAPPLAALRELQNASELLEKDMDPDNKWLLMLVDPGSSLGGARPKANIMFPDGSMWIAKFPSRHDDYDTGAWEMVAHELAGLCGINVPPARIERFSETGSTFIIKRFDRERDGGPIRRIHFASAMTMLGEYDSSQREKSYLDILDHIEKTSSDTTIQAEELWKRLVFNILISNTDDHLRNHGFLLRDDDSWALSPAYDVNPSPMEKHLSLMVDFNSNDRDIRLAVDCADYYRIGREQAAGTVRMMQETVRKRWSYLAGRYGISKQEQKRMAPAFDEAEREI